MSNLKKKEQRKTKTNPKSLLCDVITRKALFKLIANGDIIAHFITLDIIFLPKDS